MMRMNGLTSLTKIKQSKGVEWEEEIFEPRPKKAVGRPARNPFHTVECEEDFIRRFRNMVERYYHPTPNTYSDFVFAARKKTKPDGSEVWVTENGREASEDELYKIEDAADVPGRQR